MIVDLMLKILGFTLSLFYRLFKFVKKWNELTFTLPLAFVLFFYSDDLLRLIDPTTAAYDPGIFQIYLFAIIGLLLLHGATRVVMKMLWPGVDSYLEKGFDSEFFNDITPWQRLKLSSFVFFSLLFAFILLARIL